MYGCKSSLRQPIYLVSCKEGNIPKASKLCNRFFDQADTSIFNYNTIKPKKITN